MNYFNRLISLIKHYPFLIAVTLISAFGFAFFVKILEEVYSKDSSIFRVDLIITKTIADNRIEGSTSVFKYLTSLGDLIPFLLIFGSSILLLLAFKKYVSATILLFSVVGGQALVYFIKVFVGRDRPETIYSLIPESGFSFPSGHTFIAVTFWGVLGYLVVKHISNIYLKVLTAVWFIFIVLGIGLSRIYLGVHWTSDVIASYSLATAYSVLVVFVVYKRKRFLREFSLVNK